MVTITNIACLGKFTDPKNMHKAYTSPVALNPLFCSKKDAQACDKESRLWISNIQAIGDDVKNLRAFLENCMACQSACGPHAIVAITDNPREAVRLLERPYYPLIISTVPVPGHKGTMTVRFTEKEYRYLSSTATGSSSRSISPMT